MTPMRLLLLWRVRWGKPGSATLRPYAQGVVVKWMEWLIQSDFWSVPGFSVLSWGMCVSVLVLTPIVQLSDNSQIVWGAMLLAFAMGARRYEGHVYALMLGGLALAAASRYFYWRMSSTLDMHWTLDFAMGFVLLVAELYLVCLAVCLFGKQVAGSLGDGAAQAWKQGLEFFRFYEPLARAIFFVTPLVGLAWHVPMVHASGVLLLAFGLPYWVLGRFAYAALETQGRVSLPVFVHEHLVAFAVLCRTAVSVVCTLGAQLWTRKQGGCAMDAQAVPPAQAALPLRPLLVCGAGLLLHAVVLTVAVARGGWSLWLAEGGIYGLYLLWVLYNVMRLIAALAVHKELAMVERARRQGAQLSAMVRLESGYAVPCRTVNFPAMLLVLQLPVEKPLPCVPLHVSIFKGYREYTFSARLHSQQGETIMVAIEGTCADEYQALSDDVFTRDAHWPQWLAGKQADIFLPQWVHYMADLAETAFYNLVVRVSTRSLWQTCLGWFQRGK